MSMPYQLQFIAIPENNASSSSGVCSVYLDDVTKQLMVKTPDCNRYPLQNVVAIEYDGSSSYQPVAPDLTLDASAGSADGGDPSYLAAVMGNVLGEDLTKDANYIGGVIGAYSITGAKATSYPAGAVLAQITDGVEAADGAVVAYIDGDGSQTNANAAFKAMSNNSTSGSGFDYGLDLYAPAHDGYNELAILKADVRMSNQVVIMNGSGAPVDGTTGDNFAGPGSIYIDIAAGNAYLQTSLVTTPVWKLITRAA